MQRNVLLVVACCSGLLAILPSKGAADDSLVPEDTCIVELQLPPGATVSVGGKDYGVAPRLTFGKLQRQETYPSQFTIRFKDGSEEARTVLVRGGRRVRLALEGPSKARPELVPQTGQSATITSAAFSPDGKQVLTGGEDRTAILWDAAGGQQLRTFEGHTTPVISVAFRPDGKQVLTGSWDQTAILWDAASGRQLRTFKGTENGSETMCVAFSPDGRQVFTAFGDKTGILWDAAGGQQLRTLQGHTESVESVAVSADGRQVLAGSWDGAVSLWDAAGGQQLRTFQGHDKWAASVAFSPDGRQVLAGSKDKTTILWDTASGQQLRTFKGHWDGVTSVAFSPDGRQVVTGSGDSTVRLWDVATGQELARLISLDAGKDWLVVTPEGLFDGSEGGRQKVCYRVGGGLNVVPVDRFFQDFYRPGLLREIFQSQRPMPEVQLGGKLPPLLKILSPPSGPTESQLVNVEVEAIDQGGGISGLDIYNKGARVHVDSQTRREGNVLRRTFPVLLDAGINRLQVVAASEGEGAFESEPAELVLRYEKPVTPPAVHFVAIGISKYAEPSFKLRFAARDAQALADLFRRRGPAMYGRQGVHVIELLDEKATKQGIRDVLTSVAAETQPQDVLVVFLAGHGQTLHQRYYFIPYNFQAHAEQSVEDNIREYGLPQDVLGNMLSAGKALKRVLIYDTCQSGGVLGPAQSTRDAFAMKKTWEALGRTQGVFTLAAASASEEAQEIDELPHGVLTYALLAALGAAKEGPLAKQPLKPGGDSNLAAVRDWFSYAADNVPVVTESYKHARQTPQFTSGPNFPLLPMSE